MNVQFFCEVKPLDQWFGWGDEEVTVQGVETNFKITATEGIKDPLLSPHFLALGDWAMWSITKDSALNGEDTL